MARCAHWLSYFNRVHHQAANTQRYLYDLQTHPNPRGNLLGKPASQTLARSAIAHEHTRGHTPTHHTRMSSMQQDTAHNTEMPQDNTRQRPYVDLKMGHAHSHNAINIAVSSGSRFKRLEQALQRARDQPTICIRTALGPCHCVRLASACLTVGYECAVVPGTSHSEMPSTLHPSHAWLPPVHSPLYKLLDHITSGSCKHVVLTHGLVQHMIHVESPCRRLSLGQRLGRS